MAYTGSKQVPTFSFMNAQENLSFWYVYFADQNDRLTEEIKGATEGFYGCEKVEKMSWFNDLSIIKRRCIYSSCKECSNLNYVGT